MTTASKKKPATSGPVKAPALIAFHFIPAKGKKPVYIPIGAAIEHPDGEGYTLRLDLFPTGNGQILLRRPKSKDEANGNLPTGKAAE